MIEHQKSHIKTTKAYLATFDVLFFPGELPFGTCKRLRHMSILGRMKEHQVAFAHALSGDGHRNKYL